MNFVTLQYCSTFPIRLRLGRAAFAYHPFSSAAKGGRSDDYYRNYNEDYVGDVAGADFVSMVQKFNRDEPCPFCGHADDDPFHLFCECTEPALEGERDSLRASLLRMLEAMRAKIEEMILLSTPDVKLRSRVKDALDGLSVAIERCQNDPEENIADINFVAFHMLTAIPFSEKLTRTKVLGELMPAMPLARGLGRVFDVTVLTNRRLRPIANVIAKWGTRQISTFSQIRGLLLRAGLPV